MKISVSELRQRFNEMRASWSNPTWTAARVRSLSIFAPGVFFVLLGFAALLAPRLLVVMLSALLLCIGAGFIYVALKLRALKARAQSFLKQFEGKGFSGQIFVQSGNPFEAVRGETKIREVKDRKIVFH